MEVERGHRQDVAEREVGDDRPVHLCRKAAEELSKLRFIRAVGELPENHSGTAFEEAVLFEHGQAAVEFVSRFVQVLEDQDSSGRVRQERRSTERCGDGEVADQRQAGGSAAPEFGQRTVFAGRR